ncbi:MAG TPA: GNAT family N-acetyltransferase [Thermoanaerobaculia bacterium]|nr:GNAT family N-acetyltransferase [Thermoanaerobaculia bacterium]
MSAPRRHGCSIRAATVADAGAVAALAEATFRDAYVGAPGEALDVYCAEAFGAEVQRRELEDPRVEMLVAESGGEMVGYVQLVEEGAPACVAARPAIELRRIYLRRDWHGTGLAHDLFERACERARSRGAATLWLGVWEGNPRAIRFYEKAGFRVVGEQSFELGFERQRDLVLALPLVGDA